PSTSNTNPRAVRKLTPRHTLERSRRRFPLSHLDRERFAEPSTRLLDTGKTRAAKRQTFSAPDPPRHLHYQLQLALLILLRQRIAPQRRRKPALRTQRQLLHRHIPRRFLNPPQQQIDRLQLRRLRRDQPEYHHLAPRHEAQRLEPTRAFGVVLQQESI